MAEPFIGEIRAFPFNFVPKKWAPCDGRILPINEYQVLYSLLGTLYGGNGSSNFALPNLQGRAPIGQSDISGLSVPIGALGGAARTSLPQTPAHSHKFNALNANSTERAPEGKVVGGKIMSGEEGFYSSESDTTLHPDTVAPSGTSAPTPVENRQPYLTINYAIALDGIYPERP